MQQKNSQAGLIKLILILVVAVLVLSYFGISIQKVAESDAGRDNFGYISKILGQIWSWLVNLWEGSIRPALPDWLGQVMPK